MKQKISEAQWILKENIRCKREERRWSREELAERAGISAKYVQAIETGLRLPSMKVCAALADALGIPLFELFLPELGSNEGEAQLMLQGLSSEEKEELLKILKTAKSAILALR